MILRHKPGVIGITLDEHGWANVSELVEGVNKVHPLDMDHSMKTKQKSALTRGTRYPLTWNWMRRNPRKFCITEQGRSM